MATPAVCLQGTQVLLHNTLPPKSLRAAFKTGTLYDHPSIKTEGRPRAVEGIKDVRRSKYWTAES